MQNTQCNAIHNTICSHSEPFVFTKPLETLAAFMFFFLFFLSFSLALSLFRRFSLCCFLYVLFCYGIRDSFYLSLPFRSLLTFMTIFFFPLSLLSLSLSFSLSFSICAEALTACSYDVCSVKILISIWINISSLIMECECTKPYTFKILLSDTSMNSIKNEWKYT